MMNKYDVALKLLEMGADSKTQALNGDTAQDIARKFKHYHLADVLNRYFSILFCFFFQITICTKLLTTFQNISFHSPRNTYSPNNFPSHFGDIMKKLENPPVLGYIFKDDHINWRDEDGNSILHYASWTGNIYLVRNLFDSAKGKKLITVSNNQGATPLAMAIIASQVSTKGACLLHAHSSEITGLCLMK